ncbi:MAG: PilZ domain-containing protein, partial [Gammaproteobacteria bacterium]|nr:PilZ domain-containing protein [Gammaproteobacteria bacterium]
LSTREESAKIRIVEQICHIESYLQHKRYREGPFISRERVTEEWITRFAASFPTI